MKQGHWQTVAKGSTFFWQRKYRCPQKLEESVHQMQENAASFRTQEQPSAPLWAPCLLNYGSNASILWSCEKNRFLDL